MYTVFYSKGHSELHFSLHLWSVKTRITMTIATAFEIILHTTNMNGTLNHASSSLFSSNKHHIFIHQKRYHDLEK